MQLSIVIMCKNEEEVLASTIAAAQKLSTNIVIVDTGSTDGTIALANSYGIVPINANWQGFGPTKNIGITAATYDWILSLDADEVIDATLIATITNLQPTDINTVYKIEFVNYLGTTALRFGEWAGDKHIRLFNRLNAQWNNADVHEELIFITKPTITELKGNIHHKTIANAKALNEKMDYYARLNAKKYLTLNKKTNPLKKYISATFNLIKNYVFKLGFLDGVAGWIVARENFVYTYKKYRYLEQLIKEKRD